MRIRLDRPHYLWYVTKKKITQLPGVLSERTPQFTRDETCRPAVGTAFAIVVKYVKFGLSEDFLALLDCLAAESVNAIVVCNGEPSDAMLAVLRARAHRILVRRNIGRDIGAYRAATLHLNRQGLDASRVLYLNDSVIYIPGPDLARFVRALSHTTYDVVGGAENHEFEHHLGSYAFSISGRVFRDQKLLAFWRAYKPYDLRPHAIRKGELKLTTLYKRQGYRLDVIYGADELWERLHALSFGELIDHLRYMSNSFQASSLSNTLHSVASLAAMFTPPTTEARALRPLGPQPPAIPRRLLSGTDSAPEDPLLKAALIDQMMRAVTQSSQIHHGFGLMHKLLGCPIVKKDLLQRNVFVEQQIMDILDDLPSEQRAAILRELLNRGRPTYLSKYDRFLERNGLN